MRKALFSIALILSILIAMLGQAIPASANPGDGGGIGDFVWNDLNFNGIQDPNEPGIPDVGVVLYSSADGSGIPVATHTDANGFYKFRFLSPGTYSVRFAAPAGYEFSPQDQGDNDTRDSDVNPSNGLVPNIVVGQLFDFTIDAGLHQYQPASLGDLVWNDLNANGIQDSGEAGVAGVQVELIAPDQSVVATATTGGSGQYLFSNLKPGSYQVSFTAPGFVFSPANQGSDDAVDSDADATGLTASTTLIPGENDLTWDAGLYQPASLGDLVWNDLNANGLQDSGEPGVVGVSVQLLASDSSVVATATTGGSGQYLFSNLKPGSYQVSFTAPGFVFSPANQGSDDAVDSDADAAGLTASTTLTSGENDLTWDAGLYQPASLGDLVWNDLNANGIQDSGEPGVAGVSVQLLASDSSVVATATTGGSGQYLFSNLKPGSYQISFAAPGGFVFSPTNQGSDDGVDSDADVATGLTAFTMLTSDESDLTWDAGLIQIPIISPGGTLKIFKFEDKNGNKVQDDNETALSGWTFNVTDSSGNSINGATSEDGWLVFADLTPGNYSVSEQAQDNWAATTPNPQSAEVVGGDNTTVIFGNQYTPPVIPKGTLKILKFWDKDGDGNKDCQEPSLSGWTFNVVDSAGHSTTGTTNNNGWIIINNLTPGSYTVTEQLKDGWVATTPNPQNATVLAGKTASLIFGNKLTAPPVQNGALKVYKFWDKDGDGNKDCQEPSLSGWTFNVVDSAGHSTTGTTNNNGWIIINNLTPGSYTVTEQLKDGWVATTPNPQNATVLAGKTASLVFGNKQTAPPVQNGALKVYKFWDKDGDGNKDCQEPSLSGWTFNVVDSAGHSTTGTTNNNGWIIINNLTPGVYTVTEQLKDGWVATTPNPQSATLLAGKTATLVFGNKQTAPPVQNGVLKIYKFWDKDGDGNKDCQEFGLSGWTFSVVDPTGHTTTGTTDKNGWITINNLTPGNYTVTEQLKDGWVATTDNPQSATVLAGKTSTLVFGNKQNSAACQTGALVIYKFWDKNSNGREDCGESALSGWTFNIVDASGHTSSGTTDEHGCIIINKLTPGVYTITEQAKEGWIATTANPQTAHVIAGETANVVFGNKQTTSTSQNGTLKIFKFWDKNGDGDQDCDESGLSGWTFDIVDASAKSISGTTDTNGSIKIDKLAVGVYTVTERAKDGWMVTTTNPQTVSITAAKTSNLIFGNLKLASLDCGDTATIGFWNNKNGQAIINSKGGNLPEWLTTNFPNIYSQLTGKNNADAASLFKNFFNVQGQKTDAQIMATALACYFTQSANSNTLVTNYGFDISALGTGVKLYNVGSYGTALGLNNNQSYTVFQLLQQVNLLKQNGLFDSKAATACNAVFDGINKRGDIN